ncbi:MAG: hypothetical protein Q7R32_00920 [Dehalococcoidia bacterium]|nr:hypothetical protein [Dehalococcoidia bacterium]
MAGFAVAFAAELAVLALLRRILDPDPHGEQLYLVWVLVSCAALSVATAQAVSHWASGRFDLGAGLRALVLVVVASWMLWFAAIVMACSEIQTPFFAVGCD